MSPVTIFGSTKSLLGPEIYHVYKSLYENLRATDDLLNSDLPESKLENEDAVESAAQQQAEMQQRFIAAQQQVKSCYDDILEKAKAGDLVAMVILGSWDKQTEEKKRVDGSQSVQNIQEYFFSDFYWLNYDSSKNREKK